MTTPTKEQIIKCDSCDNAFYCESYFNEFHKKDRKLEVLALMCKNLGGYKKAKDEEEKLKEEICCRLGLSKEKTFGQKLKNSPK